MDGGRGVRRARRRRRQSARAPAPCPFEGSCRARARILDGRCAMSRAAAYVCRNFVEDVTAYLEGTLSEASSALVDAHLADCPHCRAYLDQMRQTVRVLGRLDGEDLDGMP